MRFLSTTSWSMALFTKIQSILFFTTALVRLHYNSLFVLITYLVLSAVPFAPLLFGQTVNHSLHIIALEFTAWITIWAVFQRPVYFHWLLLPAFIALPIELYLYKFYNQGISPHHLGILVETSPKEIFEFLGDKVWLLILILLLIIFWWQFTWYAAYRTHGLNWKQRPRWTCAVLLITCFSIWLYTFKTDTQTWPHISSEITLFGQTWPFGLIVPAYDFWKERTYLSDLQHKNRQFRFHAYQEKHSNMPQTIIVVIGESSRYDRWSLNGYQRDTTPLLKRESNLISLSDVITPVSATRLSVPVIVSRKPTTESLRAGFAEKSFITAYKEAGFKTYWISNQMTFGQFDTPVSLFASEADVIQFLNLGGFTDNASFDQVLLAPLQTAMQDSAQKKLIILHTLGNHWNYSRRYPQEFDKWKPSLFGVINPAYTNLVNKPLINNSYDNSILYTDWLLTQIIDLLKSSTQISAMLYLSDHGQTLYDNACKLAFHGHNTQFEFHIPVLMWYSDLYKNTYPKKIEQLIRHQHVKLTTENMFHSLLDLSDIHYPSEQLERSFLSNKLQPHKRYVDSYGWTDYDNATLRGDCREVIDKDKPLPQVKD